MEFAKVYAPKILSQDLKRVIKKQIQKGHGVIPHTNDSLQRMKQYLQTTFYAQVQWNYQGNWQCDVASVETGKPKIQLVPYDVQLCGLDAVVRDLVTGTEYRAPRVHAHFGAYEDPTSNLYTQGDALAIIAQLAKERGAGTELASYVGEKILQPQIADIKGEPVFIPQWLVPVTIDVKLYLTWKVQPATPKEIEQMMAVYYSHAEPGSELYASILEDRRALEKFHRPDPFLDANLKLSGGVVCDGFFGRVLENYVTDIKSCDQDFNVDEEADAV